MRKATTITVGLAALIAANVAGAQQRGAARVPNFLAVSFKSPGEGKLGVDVGEAVRQRMLRFFPMPPIRTLRVISRADINNTLTISGFPADSVISQIDLGILSKQIGAEETMDGSVKRTAQGVEARARFYFNSNMGAPEVLPAVVGKTAEDVGKKIAELYVQARKELPAYERCKNALIQGNADEAIAAARESMEAFPQGVLPRACLLTAYGDQYKKFPVDSIIRLGNEIVSIDPENPIAIAELVNAYVQKKDTANILKYIAQLDSINPADVEQGKSLIRIASNLGSPDVALRIANRLLEQTPGEPSVLEEKWFVLQKANLWKQVIVAGEEMVKFDSSKADTLYFRRQVGAAIQDSQPQLALQFLARAVKAFPKNVFFLQAYSSKLKEQGQVLEALEVAKRVVDADARAPQAYATVVSLYTQVGQTDSAIAVAKRALVGADQPTKDQIGTGLLGLIRPAMDSAQADTTSPADVRKAKWTQVLKLSASVDSIAPTQYTAFYMSVAAYYVAQHGLANFTDVARTNRQQACVMLKEASDNLLVVDLNMSRGGRVDANTASALLKATSDMKPTIEQAKRQLTCR